MGNGNTCQSDDPDLVRAKVAEELYWRDAACNWRDVGAAGGLMSDMFYRSSEVYPEEKLAQIKTIIDLRRPKDRESEMETRAALDEYNRTLQMDDDFFIPEHVSYRQINFVPTNPTGLAIFRAIPTSAALSSVAPWNDTELHMQMHIRDNLGFGGLYCIILEHSQDEVGQALRVFSDSANYPVLVHCIHGKDRTGLLVALVSLICGVSESQVIDDFHTSESELLAAKAQGLPRIAKYEDWQLAAPKFAMSQTISWLKEATGKSDANNAARVYATMCGLTHEERDSIQRCLLADHEEGARPNPNPDGPSQEPTTGGEVMAETQAQRLTRQLEQQRAIHEVLDGMHPGHTLEEEEEGSLEVRETLTVPELFIPMDPIAFEP
eukprot:TRINITY_DN11886_c0_g1_i3.p1 TRINITY_DN11886_c0_g1~~TRINITY_DN11886_c0_g1_i3.p1  ORF type:complete len:379 (-),score=103.40 TRINITY_DN11886_c0_g1_i3:410-1546(-)